MGDLIAHSIFSLHGRLKNNSRKTCLIGFILLPKSVVSVSQVILQTVPNSILCRVGDLYLFSHWIKTELILITQKKQKIIKIKLLRLSSSLSSALFFLLWCLKSSLADEYRRRALYCGLNFRLTLISEKLINQPCLLWTWSFIDQKCQTGSGRGLKPYCLLYKNGK